MPTLFNESGLRYFFYSDEHLPIHVHVESGEGRVKINVEPMVFLVENRGMKASDVRKALFFVKKHKTEIIAKWKVYHG